jgi:hypothetical protein
VAGLVVALVTAVLSAGPGARVEDALPGLLAPMPIVTALACLLWFLRAPVDPGGRARLFLFGMTAIAGIRVLLGTSYGRITTPYSILVFPGLASCAAVLAFDVFAKRRPHPEVARLFLAAVFAGAAVLAIARGARYHPMDRFPSIETPAGTLRLPADRARAFAETLRWLQAQARPGDSLSGFPEGGIFNFTLGLPNPLREDQIVPGHLDATTEPRVVRRIVERGPRFVILANQPTAAFGPVAFGRDYSRGVWSAVLAHYRLAASFGDAAPDAPVGDPRFFLRIYERNAPEPGR